jgi:hypothetical protein
MALSSLYALVRPKGWEGRVSSLHDGSLERADPMGSLLALGKGSVMISLPRFGDSPVLVQELGGQGQPAVTHRLDRVVQAALALYLIPALLIVLVVGGIGMVVLAVVRLLTWVTRGPSIRPRTPLGP